MSRVEVGRNPASYGGSMSRLPRPVPQGQGQSFGSYQPKLQNGPANGQKPSRLEQMQADFQKNLLKEKEQRMISMYEENQQKALQRVNNNNNSGNKGMVRDFFRERRALGSGNKLSQNQHQPSMEHMYNKRKLEHKMSNNNNIVRTNSYNGNYQKQSAGRDRSNLLAPINGPGKNGQSSNPFPHKAQIVRPRTYKDVSSNNANYMDQKQLPMSAPTGAMMSDYSSDDSPPPNPKQLQMLQQKRLMMKNQRNNVTQITKQPHQQQQTPKKTDFQKWQEEQEQNRANRLKKYQESKAALAQKHQPYPDDEGYDDDSAESDDIDPNEEMKRKQALLLQQIEEQQRELEKLRSERMQEEIEEKKERARRKKMEEERQRREKEEEEFRRKVEDEERIKRTYEEEKLRKIAEEKQRLRKAPPISKYEYEESDEEENYNHQSYKRPSPPPQKRQQSPPQRQQYQPSAPSKPKPSNTRKYHPPKSRTPPRRESPPLVKGDHTAMYMNADQMDGAFENVGKMVSCFNCGRSFAVDRIEKHEKFCKNLTKKRKVMDPTKLRTQGTEMAQYVGTKQPNPKFIPRLKVAPKKNNWREQHESFINAIKYAKKCKQIEEQGGNLADLPPPPRSENPDYVQCPYCTRRFNPQTAERHIPHCKNTKSRPAPPKKR